MNDTAQLEALAREAEEAALAAVLRRFDALPDDAALPRKPTAALIGRAPQTLANWGSRQARGEPVPLEYDVVGDTRAYRVRKVRDYLGVSRN
ncbi:hypothetical protein NOR53_1225 [gamma proteobacterium NOR5-3]|nr:hypothetical protein NOR53_1225 [gamma proteobacterium NOR5-3]